MRTENEKLKPLNAVPTQSRQIYNVYVILCVRNGTAAIEFYKQVFGAAEIMRIAEPDGKIAHAELKLGQTVIMLADEFPEYEFISPQIYGGSDTMVHLHVDDVDSLTNRAVDAGAVILRGPSNESHGERQCLIRDPFGRRWLLGHQIDDVIK